MSFVCECLEALKHRNSQQTIQVLSSFYSKVIEMKSIFLTLILICFTLKLCELRLIDREISDYIEVVLAYYRIRNVGILTHFTCFSLSEFKIIYNVEICL